MLLLRAKINDIKDQQCFVFKNALYHKHRNIFREIRNFPKKPFDQNRIIEKRVLDFFPKDAVVIPCPSGMNPFVDREFGEMMLWKTVQEADKSYNFCWYFVAKNKDLLKSGIQSKDYAAKCLIENSKNFTHVNVKAEEFNPVFDPIKVAAKLKSKNNGNFLVCVLCKFNTSSVQIAYYPI